MQLGFDVDGQSALAVRLERNNLTLGEDWARKESTSSGEARTIDSRCSPCCTCIGIRTYRDAHLPPRGAAASPHPHFTYPRR